MADYKVYFTHTDYPEILYGSSVIGSLDRSIDIATCCELGGRCSIRGKDSVQTCSGAHPTLYAIGAGSHFQGCKVAGT
jgi:hypothetical protein